MLPGLLALSLSVSSLALGALAGAALAAAGAALVGRRARHHLDRVEADLTRALAVVEQAPDLVLVHAPDGTGLSPNAAARDTLGLSPQSTLSLFDVVALEDQQAARAHLGAVAEVGTARSGLQLRGSGPPRAFDALSRVVDGRVITVARDVQDRVTREQQAQRERDHALAQVQEKSAFLDTMSHDLRTPLTSVLGFAELLHDEVDGDSRGLVEAIQTGGQRLLRTLDGVLDLARLDAGRQPLHPVPLDAVAAVEQIAASYRGMAEAKGLALDVEALSGSVPATLDASLLDRVVGTLVCNAVAFTEVGGVTVEVVDDAATVTLRVLDTGAGIPAADLPTMFSEYRHRPSVPGGAPVGVTALGLAVARRLVDLAGGSISVESRWGQGSAFTVVLPRGPIPELAPESVAA